MVKFVYSMKGTLRKFMYQDNSLINKILGVGKRLYAAIHLARIHFANPVIEDYRVEMVEA
jgi:hypothetical protein